METRVEQSIRLTFREGSSNKFYKVNLTKSKESEKDWDVVAWYGKIGSHRGNMARKAMGEPYHKALHIFNNLIDQKRSKGYLINSSV